MERASRGTSSSGASPLLFLGYVPEVLDHRHPVARRDLVPELLQRARDIPVIDLSPGVLLLGSRVPQARLPLGGRHLVTLVGGGWVGRLSLAVPGLVSVPTIPA